MPGDGLGDGITSAEGRLLAVQMGALRDDIREIKETMRSMSRSLEQLVRIEEQQKDMRSAISRAFDEQKELRLRVQAIETELPGLREQRKWFVGSVIGSISAIVAAAIYYFFQNHVR